MIRTNTIKILTLVFIMSLTYACSKKSQTINITPDIQLKPLAENVWTHISDIEMPKWGKVSANGMVVLTDKQLVIIDTPWNDTQTQFLIEWFKNNYDFNEIKVIVCHYHDDNLGGLNWIHQNDIESYSIKKTQEICAKKELPIPRNTLSETYRFDFHEIPIEIFFIGEGHTVDSICVYLPNERILFGGCSVKALNNSTLGNTADANLLEWPNTLQNMKEVFSEVKIVVPGHGLEGNISLIAHTLSLFQKR